MPYLLLTILRSWVDAKERTQPNTTGTWLESLAPQNRHFREEDLILPEVKVGCP